MNDFVGYIDDEGNVFDGTFQYEGQVGPIGPQGIPGYTPQRGVDYWTESDQETIVTEATSLIDGKIEEYNDNAAAKTEAFNDNASDKTTTFNSNFTSKMNKFNQNSGEQKADFNANALDKTGDFNSNAGDKTDAFDSHVTSKTTDFDSHVDDEFNELTGSFYTKSQTYSKDEVDGLISSTYHYKGSVTDYSYLPSSGQQVGDVYNLENAGGGYNAGDNVAWTGTDWDKLAGTVDLSNYYTKGQVDNIANTKQNVIDSSHKLLSDNVDDTNQTNKFVTSEEKTTWNNKSDFSGSYNDLTNKPDLTIYEEKSNKTNELSGNSTQTQYPNAEIVYKWLDSITPSNEVSGETIHVEDSSDLPIKDFTMLGNATQDTSILTYKCVGTESGDYYFVYSSTNYQFTMPTISANDLLTFNTSTKKLYKGTTQITTTTASTGTLITLSNTPNPDYPQDIHVVTGDNTVVVTGANLLNRTTCTEDKILAWVTGEIIGGYNGSLASDYIKVFPNDKMKFSYSAQVMFYDNNKTYLGCLQPGGTTIAKSTGTTFDSITVPNISNISYMRLGFRSGTTIPSFLNLNIMVNKGETLETYTPYVSQTQLISLGSIELAKIGDYIDQPFKAQVGLKFYDNLPDSIKANLTLGKWYEYHELGKLTIDEDSPIKMQDIITANSKFIWRYTTAIGMAGTGSRANLISNYYIGDTTVYNANDAIGAYVNSNNLISFATLLSTIGATTSTTSEQALALLKTWLTNNNVIFYYPLATPTTTEITDTTLISQLENILKMHTYKNVTNGWIEPTGTNAQAGMVLVYRQDIQTLITNNTNAILSLGNNT